MGFHIWCTFGTKIIHYYIKLQLSIVAVWKAWCMAVAAGRGHAAEFGQRVHIMRNEQNAYRVEKIQLSNDELINSHDHRLTVLLFELRGESVVQAGENRGREKTRKEGAD
jgi:hypothetical protein